MIRVDEPLSKDEVLSSRLTSTLARLLIVSGLFWFAPFFIAFAMLAALNSNSMWRPTSVIHPSNALGVASVALLVASGVAYLWGHAGLRTGARAQTNAGTGLALLLALAAALCYALTLGNMGFGFQSGGYASVFFGLTFVYEVLLLGLCVFLFGIANRARLGLYTPLRMAAVTAFGEFWWGFIIMGAVVYLVLYVVPFLNVESIP